MKKVLRRRKSKSQTRATKLAAHVRFSPIVAALAILVIGGLGAWAIKSSFAAGNVNVFIEATQVNPSTGTAIKNLAGVTTYMYPYNCSGHPGAGGSVLTGSNGVANYGNCQGNFYCIEEDQTYIDGYTYAGYRVFTGGGAVDNGGGCASAPDGGSITFQVKFHAIPATPTVNLSANPTTITKGANTTLSWSSTNATACSFTAGGANSSNATNGSVTVAPQQTTTYTLNCVNGGPSANKSVTVSVNNPPPAGSGSTTKPPATTPTTTTPKPTTNSVNKPQPAAVAATVVATSGDTNAPSKPDSFTGTLSEDGKKVSLSWSAASDNVGVASYLIERSTNATDWSNVSTNATGTTFEDTTLPEGASTYYYRLRAQDAVGNQSEATFVDVASLVSGSSEAAQAVTEQSGGNLSLPLLAGGGLLVLLALGGGIWWWRCYSGHRANLVDGVPVASMMQTASTTGSAPVPGTVIDKNTPPPNYDSKSIGEMVAEMQGGQSTSPTAPLDPANSPTPSKPKPPQ